jgi:LmbE family N-acetylglucosaminyl deacetylase
MEAARILSVESVVFLRWPDSEVEPTLALRRELVRQIRRHRPDLVITHDPVPPYRLHPDHRAVGRATLDALFPCARDPLTFPEQIRDEGLQAHIVPEVWLFATEVPDIWIDIAEMLPRKIAARLAHASQHTDPQELERHWQKRAGDIGAIVGLSAAEAFKRVDLR